MPAEVKPYHLVEAGQKGSVIFFGKVLTKKRECQKNCYNYYPFGLSFNSYQDTTETRQNYLYNGKELQTDLGLDWYDYGARMYDAALGRWHVVDPMAEEFYNENPYCYVGNSPLLYVDPNGQVKFSFNGSLGISTGILDLGTEFLGGTIVPFGGVKLNLKLSLSFDTESMDLTFGVSGSKKDIKAGSWGFAAGSGGEKSETKTAEAKAEFGVNMESGDFFGSTTIDNDDDYKTEESGTIGMLTISQKEDEGEVITIGIKDASFELFFLGAEAAVNITAEPSEDEK